MESALSSFPIVQHEPGSGRRSKQNTFVRAHVMERYHRRGRASPCTAVGRALGGHNYGESIEVKPSKSLSPELSTSQVPTAFIEYKGPHTRKPRGRRKAHKREADAGGSIVPSGLSIATPNVNTFQLKDPRVQQSFMFMEVYKAYFEILETRQTGLDMLSKTWLPAASSDLALFHAILFNFSQNLYALCSIDHENPAFLMHKVYAIRQISSRMESKAQGCSDAVIASILCLVGHELLNKDTSALQAHMSGLRQIIDIRGGVDMLGIDGTLKTVYLNYELLLATVFVGWETNLSPSPLVVRPTGCATPPPTKAATPIEGSLSFGAYKLHDKSIRELNKLESLFSQLGVFLVQPIAPTPLDKSNAEGTDHVHEALGFAVKLRLFSTNQASDADLVEMLKFHLDKTLLPPHWRSTPGALLFCLVIGMNASEATSYRPWFLANFIRLTTGMAFENWEGLKECLWYFNQLGIVN